MYARQPSVVFSIRANIFRNLFLIELETTKILNDLLGAPLIGGWEEKVPQLYIILDIICKTTPV